MKAALREAGDRLQHNAGLLILLVLTLLVLQEVLDAWTSAREQRSEQAEADRPITDWVSYASVRFVEADEAQGVLLMESTVTWFARVDRIVWSDRLRCRAPSIGPDVPPREWPIWSTQEETAVGYLPNRPGELVTRPWSFTGDAGPGTDRAPFPTDDRTCIMVSTILVENGGNTDEVTVESPPFRPGDDE